MVQATSSNITESLKRHTVYKMAK